MRLLLVFFFLIYSSCNPVHVKKTPAAEKDWAQLYSLELLSALKNDDDQAFYFFWPLYLKELNKKKYPNEALK